MGSLYTSNPEGSSSDGSSRLAMSAVKVSKRRDKIAKKPRKLIYHIPEFPDPKNS